MPIPFPMPATDHGHHIGNGRQRLFEVADDVGPRLSHGQTERNTAPPVEEDRLLAVAAAALERREGIAASHHDALSAVAAAQRERDESRRSEREHRIALDRALEELAGTRGHANARVEGEEYLEGELERKERALVRAQAELGHQRRALARAQAELAGITGSLSWKLTAPLRSGKRILSRSR